MIIIKYLNLKNINLKINCNKNINMNNLITYLYYYIDILHSRLKKINF